MTRDEIRAELAAIVAATPLWVPVPTLSDDQPPPIEPDCVGVVLREAGVADIMLGTDEHRVIRESIEALANDKEIYHRGGTLVRVNRATPLQDEPIKRSAGSATICPLPTASLRERLTRWCNFQRLDKDGDPIDAHPPTWLVNGVDARGEWEGIRSLVGLSDTPILRADGSVCQEPGYDAATGVLYLPGDDFPRIPESLDGEDAFRASESLLETVCDFAFETVEHKAAWMAGLLTPLARYAFEGPSPLFLIDANIRGAGKGLLAHAIGMIASGRQMPISMYVHDDSEMRKRVTSIAMAGDRLILLDNVVGQFGNATIDAVLTGPWWKDRILGLNRDYDGPLLATWYATGNNVQIDGNSDVCRRIVHIRLDVMDERPEERSGFRHANLIRWIRDNRKRLLTDALTILAAFIRSGRPQADVATFGSFEGWSDLVRQAVIWVGLPDPNLTRVALAESSDGASDALQEFIAAAVEYDWQNRGFVATDLIRDLYADGIKVDDAVIRMRAAVENLCGMPPGRTPTPRQLGNKFRSFRRRVNGDYFLDCEQGNRGGKKWRVLTVSRVA